MNVQDLADVAYASFETIERPSGEMVVRTTDEAPAWVSEMVRKAHGDMFPDDYRYAMIQSACACISDSDDPGDAAHEWADAQVSVYNAARAAWLASRLERGYYCDEALSQFGQAEDVYTLLGWGWYMEAGEVYGLVLRYLETKADEEDAE